MSPDAWPATTAADRLHLRIAAGLLIVVFAWFAWSFAYGERVRRADGLGWDGARYAAWAQTGPSELLGERLLSTYYVSRIVPLMAVYYGSRLVGYSIDTTPAVINAFYVYNCLVLLLSATILWLIARSQRWSPQVTVFAFAAAFVSFPVLKLSTFNPTLTDWSALVVGFATAYLFLQRRLWGLLAVTVVGAFTWPSVIYAAVPLMIFPNVDPGLDEEPPSRLADGAAAATGALFAVGSVYLFNNGLRIPDGTNSVNEGWMYVSAAALFAYLFFGLRRLAHERQLGRLLSRVSWLGLCLAPVAVVAIGMAVASLSNGEPGPLTMPLYFQWIGQAAIVNPFVYVVAHHIYFGPAVVLLLLLWKPVARQTSTMGLGALIFVAMYVVLTIGTESRQYMNAWPFAVVLLASVLERRRIGWKFVWWFTGISFLVSRVWLPINQGVETGIPLEFPDQLLFMNFGPWMSNTMYVVFAVVTVAVAGGLALLLKREGTEVAA